jgi:thiamine biosynthesis lipoprotein
LKQFLFLWSVLLCFFYYAGNCQEKKFSFTREKMASPFTIILYSDDSVQATLLADEGFRLVDSFVNIFSDYIEQSELSRLSSSSGSGRFVPVSSALFEIISESHKAYLLSQGAFDITMGPVIRLWRKARKEKQFPDSSAIAEKMKSVGFKKIRIDNANKRVHLVEKGMQLDLGGIAQGYIAQKVLERLFARGMRKVLIDVSGDIAAGNPPPGKEGWVVGINLPESEKLQKEHLLLKNQSVSTSGDIYQFIEHQGMKYSHIVDPGTGYGITSQRNVTVIAGNATTADWLATACSIMPIKQATQLAEKLHAEVLIAEMKNGAISRYSTKSFAKLYFTNNRNL